MNLKIERIKEENAKEVLALNQECWETSYGLFMGHDTISKIFKHKKSSEGFLNYKKAIHNSTNWYIAKDDKGKIIGYVDFGKCLWDERFKSYGEIKAIYVLPSYQHKGIGTTLLKFALNKLKECNFKNIILTTFEKNYSAIKFYEHFGFHILEKYPKGTWHDNLFDELSMLKYCD